MLSDPKVLRLLELLVERKVSALEPAFAPRRDTWVSYPFAEAELGADPAYVTQLLEDLHRLGYLDRQFAERVVFCPACNSQDLKLVASCPKCGSQHLTRLTVLRHKNCGYLAPESEFQRGGERVCPKCRVELALVGADYERLGGRHRCASCGELVEAPVERWHCRACRRAYDKGDVREQVMYSYLLNKAQLARLRAERIPKARVREFLTREGYEVQESVRQVGRSGAEHEVDMLAVKRTGPLEHRVVVGFASGEEAVDSEEVVKLYAKAYDVNAQDTILVASPRLSAEAGQFAAHYHIRVYNAEDLDRPDSPAAR
uniref:Thaumarchaeal output domain-containing protein n=1 Tax=candidate division WOR-3 bacterium TaxID=2052148 RepID=A0A7C4GFM1_UNCW3